MSASEEVVSAARQLAERATNLLRAAESAKDDLDFSEWIDADILERDPYYPASVIYELLDREDEPNG